MLSSCSSWLTGIMRRTHNFDFFGVVTGHAMARQTPNTAAFSPLSLRGGSTATSSLEKGFFTLFRAYLTPGGPVKHFSLPCSSPEDSAVMSAHNPRMAFFAQILEK